MTDWHMHWILFISCWLVCYGLQLAFVSAKGQHAQAENSRLSEAHLWQRHTCTCQFAKALLLFCCTTRGKLAPECIWRGI
uniref:Uncharacterized protein n=1 Tax=Rhipicephalus appendiculatus TaxID=34631 RepID=A0A131YDR4_RHIAP